MNVRRNQIDQFIIQMETTGWTFVQSVFLRANIYRLTFECR